MVRLTDRPDMTLDVYRGRKTTIQQLAKFISNWPLSIFFSKLYFVSGFGFVAQFFKLRFY